MTNFREDQIWRWKLNNFCEDRIRRRKLSFLSTYGHPCPHCFWSKSLLTARCPAAPHRRPPTTHHHPPSLPPGLPHRRPATPESSWSTAARRPPPGPYSIEAAASSTASLAQPERTPPWQPIASDRSERRPPRQRLPHDTLVPDLHCWPHFFFAHGLKH
jgi:hypothetical protein